MPKPPNVIWITLDSIRSDHTTMDGYKRDTTPNLDRIANDKKGRWFSNCISHGNSTRISTASITTGTNPSYHGVRGDRIVPDEVDTVPEILSNEGYRTACLSRNANSSMGFDKGFDDFRWIASSTFLENVPVRTMAKYFLNIRKHSAGVTTDTAKHATPFIINDMAKRWMNSYSGEQEPFFLYLHYNEPHRPYYPPLSCLDEYTDEISMSTEEAVETAMYMHENVEEIIANGCNFTDEEWEALYAMYDAEIKYTDECVGRLFDYVESTEFDNQTVFVITADHGELFGEQGLLAHKVLLHDALVNVPLVIHGIDDIVISEDDLVQHSDIMKMLVKMADGKTEQFDGVDIRKQGRKFAVSQNWIRDDMFKMLHDINPEFDASRYHRKLVTGIRTKEYKYQKSEKGSELFKLPDEDNDISDEEP
ncbi:MAG: sulfatase, partial [Halobacteria archaeon]|nr:sulfatase [Halobacteria archaeon]